MSFKEKIYSILAIWWLMSIVIIGVFVGIEAAGYIYLFGMVLIAIFITYEILER